MSKQTDIREAFKKNENANQRKAGLPQALFEDVVAATSAEFPGMRQPLTVLQRSKLERTLLQQRALHRRTVEDLELLATGLGEMNPRSPYRPRQEELHRRTVERLAAIGELVTSLQLQLERDNEDKSYAEAYRQQRKEVEEYEKRQQECRNNATSIKPRSEAAPASSPQPMTSRQAIAQRQQSQKWPNTQDFTSNLKIEKSKPKIEAKTEPDIIPESPLPLPTPAGSRRSRSRLLRTLSPGVRHVPPRSSSSSDTSSKKVLAKLSTKNRKLYKKLRTKIESEQVPESKLEKVEADQYDYQWSTGHQQVQPQPEQQLTQRSSPRQPVRRESNPELVEARLQFHACSTLGQAVLRDYPTYCPLSCLDFALGHVCDHATLDDRGRDPSDCRINCLDYQISGICPHLPLNLSEFTPYPQPQLQHQPQPQPEVDPAAAAEVKEEVKEEEFEPKLEPKLEE